MGKTDISLAVARALNGEIISADSAAVFRGLDIGTAKPSWQARQQIPHHGLDLVDARESFSVADYQAYATEAIREIEARGHRPILVGGTGLWIRAVIRNYRLPEEAGVSPLRAALTQQGQRDGFASLRRQLRVVDPASYAAISGQDHRRLVRALEVFMTTGRPLVRQQDDPPRYRAVYWVLTRSVSELHERIHHRIEEMIARGLVEEVHTLLATGIPKGSQSLSVIGYREMVDWLFGRVTDQERNALILRHTHQLAKRQLTWFRSEKNARWLDLSAWPGDAAVQKIVESVSSP